MEFTDAAQSWAETSNNWNARAALHVGLCACARMHVPLLVAGLEGGRMKPEPLRARTYGRRQKHMCIVTYRLPCSLATSLGHPIHQTGCFVPMHSWLPRLPDVIGAKATDVCLWAVVSPPADTLGSLGEWEGLGIRLIDLSTRLSTLEAPLRGPGPGPAPDSVVVGVSVTRTGRSAWSASGATLSCM